MCIYCNEQTRLSDESLKAIENAGIDLFHYRLDIYHLDYDGKYKRYESHILLNVTGEHIVDTLKGWALRFMYNPLKYTPANWHYSSKGIGAFIYYENMCYISRKYVIYLDMEAK